MIFVEMTVFRADRADGDREVLGKLVGAIQASLNLKFGGDRGLPLRSRFERLRGVGCVADIQVTDMEAFQKEQRRGDDQS